MQKWNMHIIFQKVSDCSPPQKMYPKSAPIRPQHKVVLFLNSVMEIQVSKALTIFLAMKTKFVIT